MRTPAPVIQPETSLQNKIYHCRSCQQLFFNLKIFERHVCQENNNQKTEKNDIIKNTLNKTKMVQIEESLLKHPLVKKTLIETYKNDEIINSSSIKTTFFFICTTCGYRGNTARGVKQHGK